MIKFLQHTYFYLQVELLNVYTKDDEWNILGKPSVERNVMYYACCKEPYPDVSFKFRIQRDSPAYRAIIVLPCLGKYMLRFIKSDFKILKDMIFQIRLYLLWITHPTRYLVGCIIQKRHCSIITV